MIATKETTVRPSLYLGVSGIAVPLVFGVLVVVGGALQEGYSHASQTISELGGVEADRPILQNLNFLVTGLLVMAFALGLHRDIGRGRGSVAGPLLIGLFGLNAAVAQSLLPCDPGCEFETLTGTMHNVTGLASFAAVVAGITLVSRRFRDDPVWRSFATPTRLTAAAGLLALIAWIGIGKGAGVDSVDGVLQRLFLSIVLGWIGVSAARLWIVQSTPLKPVGEARGVS